MVAICATGSRPGTTRSRRRLILAALAVSVALAGLVGLRALSAPRALSFGNAAGTTARVGEVRLIGMGSSSKDIVVRHAEAVLSADSAAAAVSVLVCHSATPSESIGAARGWASLGQFCESVVAATGAHLHAYENGSTFDYFVLTVVPLARGPIVIDGIRVTHSGRWRDVTERTGSVVTVNSATNN